MSNFAMSASEYMTSPIVTIASSAPAVDAEALLDDHQITAVGVTDERGSLVGVLSRTDLLKSASGEVGETLRLAQVPVAELMSKDPAMVAADTPLKTVAKLMLKRRFHRIFIERDGAAIGVLSARDIMRAVHDKRVRMPAIEVATKAIIRVRPEDPIALAVERLDVSNRHGLIVVEEGWPVGIFAQRDALLGRARDPRTPVEDVMELRILALPPQTPLHRAAHQALAMNVRRLVLVDERSIAGVVSTFDFCRVVA